MRPKAAQIQPREGVCLGHLLLLDPAVDPRALQACQNQDLPQKVRRAAAQQKVSALPGCSNA